MSKPFANEIWFVTGSQHLYGPETLKQVTDNSQVIVKSLDAALPTVTLVAKPVMTEPEMIRSLCLEANANPNCAGLILWMHTFSPAKMWIGGLTKLSKPVCHMHTQFNKELPWEAIDMDFMNLNQAAHGDREAGHLHTRIGLRRKVIVGHWSSAGVKKQLGSWAGVALSWADWQGAKFVRFGDNMRFVLVTDGDKVSAEAQFGFSTNTHGVGDLVKSIDGISDLEATKLTQEYSDLYGMEASLKPGAENHGALMYAAKQELGIKAFLLDGGFRGFTTTFEDLHGLGQLPGLACQRLMDQGYGFGAEGDWKTAALLRAFKTMEAGNKPGTSFMEDYTYDLTEGKESVLGAHMLEICPSIAAVKPRLEVHPLGIGGKSDPVRLVFDARTGTATNTTLVDLGHRFRFIVNEVDAIKVPPMPKLPVARALWKVKPNFADGIAAWIHAGGAHHTVYSYNVTTEQVRDFANIAGVECIVIDSDTRLRNVQNELRWNQGAFSGRA